MDGFDRDTILLSLIDLNNRLDLNQRFLSLLQNEYRVFSKQMVEDIMKHETPRLEFCQMLVKRGPNAYNNFVRALKDTKQVEVLRVLDVTRSNLEQPAAASPPIYSSNEEFGRNKVLEHANYIGVEPTSPIIRTTPATDAVPSDYEILNFKVTIGNEIKGLVQDVYPNCNLSPRGLALIINFDKFNKNSFEPRKGSEQDVIHLDKLLQQLGYKVTIKSDLTLQEMIEVLAKFTQDEGHSQADSTVVAVMSHGKSGTHDDGTLIHTKDYFISSEDILRRFNSKNCPLLKDKPKIFFFQFCRGGKTDIGEPITLYPFGGTVTDGCAVPASATEMKRSFDDMLITYATLPGYVSYREEGEGSWFIKALCLTFTKYAHECHVDRLMQLVDEQLKRWTTMPGNWVQTLEIIKRGFNREFYFNPGLAKD